MSPSTPPNGVRVVDRWDGGVGWLARPDERLLSASHALRTDAGVWVLDPLDAPGVDELVAGVGDVAGVAVLSSWHARDAGTFAERYGVPLSVPTWLDRVEERVDAPVRRFTGSLPGTRYRVLRTEPLPTWQEAMLHRDDDGTLVVPESLGTARSFTVAGERLGVSPYRRLVPPRESLGDLSPERVLVGHGEGVFDRASEALADALAGSRRRAPRAYATRLGSILREWRESARR